MHVSLHNFLVNTISVKNRHVNKIEEDYFVCLHGSSHYWKVRKNLVLSVDAKHAGIVVNYNLRFLDSNFLILPSQNFSCFHGNAFMKSCHKVHVFPLDGQNTSARTSNILSCFKFGLYKYARHTLSLS